MVRVCYEGIIMFWYKYELMEKRVHNADNFSE